MKKLTAMLLIVLLLAACIPAHAANSYNTYTLGSDGELIKTQMAYEPIEVMARFDGDELDEPADLRLGPDGNLYIADKGNSRVLVVDLDGNVIREIKRSMKEPTGVWPAYDENGHLMVYVASASKGIQVYDEDGKVVRTYGMPTHPLYGAKDFKPSKVVLDKRGNLYIIATGNSRGIIQISPTEENGRFLGYYGASSTNIAFLTQINAMIYGKDAKALEDTTAISANNLTIDEKGMVYTVSTKADQNALRRLNVAGKDTMTIEWMTDGNSAVAVHKDGAIFSANASGQLVEYTSEGALLFVFGAQDKGGAQQRMGLFETVTGLVVDDNYNLYVLDSVQNSITVLAPTEFTNEVHTAFNLFQAGAYEESEGPWTNVKRMNSLFTYASTGLGEAQYRRGEFEDAMENYRNGGYRQGYSDAYWEQRSNWLHENMGTILIGAVVLLVVWKIIKLIDRRLGILKPFRMLRSWLMNIPIINRVMFCFYMLRNPYDACYGIKREKRASYLSAIIVLTIFFVLYVLNKYFAGFLFKGIPDGYFELINDFLLVYGAFLLLVICAYLVCTITDGEARFRDIFISGAYALAPMIVFMPIRLVLSNVLTFNEQFFITLIDFVSIGWTLLLIVLMLMYQNDYTLGKTFKTIVMTLFCLLIVVALAVVLYMLISQLVDFIVSIYGEVVYRFVKKV